MRQTAKGELLGEEKTASITKKDNILFMVRHTEILMYRMLGETDGGPNFIKAWAKQMPLFGSDYYPSRVFFYVGTILGGDCYPLFESYWMAYAYSIKEAKNESLQHTA